MSKKIEILENTLLKLLVRRGDDIDRRNVTLSEGELGYTTDTSRLYVGDGATLGGKIVGNKFLGETADHTTLTEGAEGDLAYNTTSNNLYVKTSSGWTLVSQVLEAADGSIVIDNTAGTISVGTLGAANLSAASGITGNSIELVAGAISLSAGQIKTDTINTESATYLSLPEKIKINSVEYDFPVGGLANNTFLGTDTTGSLRWASPEKSSTFYFNSSSAAVPVGSVVAAASGTAMPDGWLLCDGSSISTPGYPDLHAVIAYEYGGSGSAFNLPDYTDTVLVGTSDISSFVDGTLTDAGADYTTKGVVYFIKAEADQVVETTLSVAGSLTATKDGTLQTGAFSLLDGAVEIGAMVPGITVDETAGTSSFTTKATYTKFWITGSGAKGATRTGGAAATVYGILSAPIGTTVDYTIGAGATTNNTDGNPTFIEIGGTELARSVGAEFQTSGVVPDGNTNTGNLSTSEGYILGGHVIKGGRGGWDTNDNTEDVGGTASFWGSDNVAGAGAGGHNGDSVDTADGLVKFEWGI